MSRQHLIFDADDTLWENNIYFEEAFDQFCAYLNHSTLTPDEVRAVLDEIERTNNQIHGYGSVNFGRNLSQCHLHLAERAVDEHDVERVKAFAHEILSREVELLPGVEETFRFWPNSTNRRYLPKAKLLSRTAKSTAPVCATCSITALLSKRRTARLTRTSRECAASTRTGRG